MKYETHYDSTSHPQWVTRVHHGPYVAYHYTQEAADTLTTILNNHSMNNQTNASAPAEGAHVSHTPGPWSIYREPGSEWALVMAGGPAGRIVANVNAESCPDISSAPAFVRMPQDANARLIAAAPDLLAAVNAVLGLIGNVDHSIGNGANAAKLRGDKLNDIRTILANVAARAEGIAKTHATDDRYAVIAYQCSTNPGAAAAALDRIIACAEGKATP